MRRAVLIFARSPRAEAAAKQLKGRLAERLFQTLIAAWVHAARRCRAEVIVACDPAHRTAFPAGVTFIDQSGGSFGEKLEAAARSAFQSGHETVLMTGIDAPPPAGRELERALSARAAVAPSPDGGVNFIVLRQEHTAFLSSIETGERALLARCRQYFGADLCLLPSVTDIDSPGSLSIAAGEPAWRRYSHLLAPLPPASLDDPVVVSVPVSPVSLRAPPLL